MIQIEIEKIAIDKIKPYEKNAKIHTGDQIEQIKQSIQEFGNNDPIAVDENNEIIEGHGRLIALKELGYKEVEIIRLSHLNKSQKKAYIIAHNKLTMNTGFDYDILKDELDFLDDDLQSLTGFSDFEIENILNGDDFISNLDEVDLINHQQENFFCMSFLFPREVEDTLKDYVKDNGKEPLVDEIIKVIKKGGN